MFNNHDPVGDILYGADISTHPKFQGQGIGTMMYMAMKKLVIKLNLKRMVVGGRLYNYYKQAHKMCLVLICIQISKDKASSFSVNCFWYILCECYNLKAGSIRNDNRIVQLKSS